MAVESINVEAPGKIILFGEHAVVYDKFSIACSIGLKTRAVLKSNQSVLVELPDLDTRVEFELSHVEEALSTYHSPKMEFPAAKIPDEAQDVLGKLVKVQGNARSALMAFWYLYLQLAMSPTGLHLRVESEIPVGAGLGSSASFSVCLASCLLQLFGRIQSVESEASKALVNAWAFAAEQVIHGTPSGLDNTVSTYGGLMLYKRSQKPEHLSNASLRFLLVNTKVPRDTSRLVKGVRTMKDAYPAVVEPLLTSIENISLQVVDRLRKHCVIEHELSQLININHHLLNALGVGHASLDRVVQIANAHGLSAKLTGAGGGGCALIYLPSKTDVHTIKLVKEALSADFDLYDTTIGGKGVLFNQLPSYPRSGSEGQTRHNSQ